MIFELRFVRHRPEGGKPELIDRAPREVAPNAKAALEDAKRRLGTAGWPGRADTVEIVENGQVVERWRVGQDDA